MATDRPNILSLWGDHIGSHDISHNNKWLWVRASERLSNRRRTALSARSSHDLDSC